MFFCISVLLIFNGFASCNQPASTKTTTVVNDSSAITITLPDSVTKFANHATAVYDSTKKYIYLTFDDGPQNGTTTVFELCKQYNIKATFFMVGLHTDRKSDGHFIVNNIKNAYPQILLANHSFTHAKDRYRFFYQHPQMAAQDFYKAQQSLSVPYKIIRLPGNSAWVTNNEIKASGLVKPVCVLLDSAGFNVIGWDVEWNFNHKTAYPVQSPQTMIALIDSAFARNHTHTSNHLVILTHDRMFRLPQYANELATFISLLRQHGNYVFETVDHYPNLKPL